MSDQSSNPARPEDLVLTPGGRRPGDRVHPVRPGEAVSIDDRGQPRVIPRPEAAGPIRERNLPIREDLVLTPGGYRHPSLVHRVELGHAVHVTDGKLRIMDLATNSSIDIPEVTARPGDVPGFGSGWIAYAYWLNTTGHPISSFRTTWQVPSAPATQSGQTIYLFNGIDPSNVSSGILQPVLQFGPSPAGGGSYWSVASWYVSGNGHAFYTTPVQVNVGDTVVGVMTLTGKAGGNFNYISEFQGMPATILPVQNLPELVWCNQTLEAYRVGQCSDYPASTFTALRAINIQTGTTSPELNWTPVNQVTDCGQHAIIVSNSATEGEVNIYYRAPQFQFPFDQIAQQVRILFGVTNDGDGVAILPSGHIIHIPPGDPSGPLFRQIAAGIAEVARGFGVQQVIADSAVPSSSKAIGTAILELMAKSLESVSQAVNKALTEASNGGTISNH
jgi:hypothetical protein